MKKVKTLVKKIFGRPSGKPYTIDAISKTIDGYCVTGWHFRDQVRTVCIRDSDGSHVEVKLNTIARDDVQQVTGRSAKGFELVWKTDRLASDFYFVATTSNNQEETVKLSSSSIDFSDITGTTKIESKTDKKSKLQGCCEFAIVSEKHLYLTGWMVDGGNAEDCTVLDGIGAIIADIRLEEGIRVERPDVENVYTGDTNAKNSGFAYLFKLSSPINDKSLTLSLKYEGESVLIPVDSVYDAKSDPMLNAMRLLNNWRPNDYTQLVNHNIYHQMLMALFPGDTVVDVVRSDYNKHTSPPTASLIIPLYGRYDFMRYQLSKFSRDPYLSQCEVIYVVDDPKITPDVQKLAREMAFISTQPFSVLELSQNVGFARANNIGVEHAHSEIVALINSDIMPAHPGWLEPMVSKAKDEETGIVGSRLLYEDDSLQHDGMAPMTISEYPGLLFNDHPKKGWPKSLAPYKDGFTPCSLLTAACWVMRKDLFQSAGGFNTDYVLGDFEDSDLCLQVTESGRKNYIYRDAQIYHLERQSQNLVEPGRWKHNITILNAIYFTKKWKSKLEEVER